MSYPTSNQKVAMQLWQDIINNSPEKITAICDNHQNLAGKDNKGVVFVAIPGAHFDPRSKLEDIINLGVSAIVYDNSDGFVFKDLAKKLKNYKCKLYGVTNLRALQGFLASLVFKNPSSQVKVLAITGTNGKTSTAWAIAEAFTNTFKEQPAGVIGTLGYGVIPNLTPLTNTTPSAINVQQYLTNLINDKCQIIVCETTSIALEQGRLNGCEFYNQTFTNLSRDHLDYHKHLADYFECKQKLFFDFSSKNAIINLNDEHGIKLWSMRTKMRAQSFWGLAPIGETWVDANNKFVVQQKIDNKTSTVFAVKGESAENFVISYFENGKVLEQNIKSKWTGRYNLENLALAAINLRLCEVSWNDIAKTFAQISMPSGRLQKVEINSSENINLPNVYVDFAHTPDGLEKVLVALQNKRATGKLWCIFGCGGNRDRGKRPVMGKIAIALADEVVITSDNPRNEEKMTIIGDIIPEGFVQGKLINAQLKKNIYIESERKLAIEYVINNARVNDVILIAGKGHETYQEICEVKYPFSDYEVAKNALQNRLSKTAIKESK